MPDTSLCPVSRELNALQAPDPQAKDSIFAALCSTSRTLPNLELTAVWRMVCWVRARGSRGLTVLTEIDMAPSGSSIHEVHHYPLALSAVTAIAHAQGDHPEPLKGAAANPSEAAHKALATAGNLVDTASSALRIEDKLNINVAAKIVAKLDALIKAGVKLAAIVKANVDIAAEIQADIVADIDVMIKAQVNALIAEIDVKAFAEVTAKIGVPSDINVNANLYLKVDVLAKILAQVKVDIKAAVKAALQL
ncbi:hypothetical protein BGX27_004329 [Mortierella sp. AM989]|nr:hypothetical protein BGX27_004329 [Mortierella sp. AM989]